MPSASRTSSAYAISRETGVDVGQWQAREEPEAATMRGTHACTIVVAFAVDGHQSIIREQAQAPAP